MASNALAIWTDGGARGNPGPAGIGVRIASVDPVSGEVLEDVAQLSEAIGETTNNQAEYRALVLALDWLAAHADQVAPDATLTFYTDSELMAYQIQGKYRVKNEELKPLYERVISMLRHYANWSIMPVRREKNQVADRLVNQAIDAALAANP